MLQKLLSLAVALTVGLFAFTGCASDGEPSWYQYETFTQVPQECNTTLTIKITIEGGDAILDTPAEIMAGGYTLNSIYFPISGSFDGVPAGCLGSTTFMVTTTAANITIEVTDNGLAQLPYKVPRKVIVMMPDGKEVIASVVQWKGSGVMRFETF